MYATGLLKKLRKIPALSIHTLKTPSDFLAKFPKASFFLRPNLGHPVYGYDKDNNSCVIFGVSNQAEIFCDNEQEVKDK